MFFDTYKKKWLLSRFEGAVKFDEPMSMHTSFRVGGPAKVFVKPNSFDDLLLLVSWIRENKIPYFIIGGGTNLLVKDKGIDAVLISLGDCLKKISMGERGKNRIIVNAGAGVKTHLLCSFAIKNSLKGMNFALGIPGTIGGGIVMNAGTAIGSIAHVLHEITILGQKGEKKTIPAKNIKFGYRGLTLLRKRRDSAIENFIILEASFSLTPGNPLKIKDEADIIIAQRKKKQPTDLPSAGCFFKNPNLKTPAARLIDQAGLRGLKKGGAMISPKHANFIINVNNASAADILSLSKNAQDRVENKFNIKLVPEVIIVGK